MSSTKKKCFIITPIGDEKSITRENADSVIHAIKLLKETNNLEWIIPHHMSEPGSITKQVIECILNCDLVIANLTELNPNVMYELAVRHASGKPVIVIAEYGTKLPFDISVERTIFYSNDIKGAFKLQEDLSKMITSIKWDDDFLDNPIYRAKRDFKMKETVSEGKEAYILEQFDSLNRKINRLMDYQIFSTSPEIRETIKRPNRHITYYGGDDLNLDDASIFKKVQEYGGKIFEDDSNYEILRNVAARKRGEKNT